LQEVVDKFFDDYADDTEYRQAVQKGWSKVGKKELFSKIHYEFHCANKKSMNIAFHIEDDNFVELANTIEQFKNQKVGNKIIEFDQSWFKGKRDSGLGQIFIKFAHDYTTDEVAKTMREFIDMTQDEIFKAIKQIKDEQKK
jgi:hypothetical protein